MTTTATVRGTRSDSRRDLVLDVTAALFAEKGFHGTSLRDIAKAVGMLPGSIYCHFPSKSHLLLAVYEEGVARVLAQVDRVLAAEAEPWTRLELACRAHLEMLLDSSPYAKVVVRVLPGDAPDIAAELIALRNRYEERFRQAIRALELAPGQDPNQLRLLLLGALNWAQAWYRPGRESPAAIAEGFVSMLKLGVAPAGQKSGIAPSGSPS